MASLAAFGGKSLHDLGGVLHVVACNARWSLGLCLLYNRHSISLALYIRYCVYCVLFSGICSFMAIWTQPVEDNEWSRRAFLVCGVKGALGLTLIGRLFDLQILKGDYYRLLSDNNRIQTWCEPPVRGLFLDVKGRILADNEVIHSCYLAPEGDAKQVDALQSVLALGDDRMAELEKKLRSKRRTHPLLIKSQLSWQELVYLEMHLPDLPSIMITPSFWRHYPYGSLFCHVLGYVGWPSKAERNAMSEEFPAIANRGAAYVHIGKTALEKVDQPDLMGHHGLHYMEVDAYGRKVRTLHQVPSESGKNMSLTLDLNAQRITAQMLQEAGVEGGCAIVMEASTGAVKACVSLPDFDPHVFLKGLSHQEWEQLRSTKALVNKAINGAYAPGSTFKMMIMLAALHSGIVDERTQYNCPGHLDVGGHTFYCHSWRHGGHGFVHAGNALAYSCDVYFYHLAMRLSFEVLEQVCRDFGLGQASGIELPDERTGLIPTPAWRAARKQKWTMGDAINMAIGQGAVLSTPMQLVRMMAILNNGFNVVTPHLHAQETPVMSLPLTGYNDKHIAIVKQGMEDVVQKPWGTCRRACIPGLSGKSGSTQVCRVTQEQRDDPTFWENRPRHLIEHALFVGYKDPYAIVVLVEHGGSGGKVAAPIGARILSQIIDVPKSTPITSM